MRNLLISTSFALATAMLAWALTGQTGEAQIKKGKDHAAQTKYLMRGVVGSGCGSIGGLLKKGPSDDKAWEALACHASILNEMSYVLMDDGRCPDKVWAGAAKALRESSAKVLAAAEAKDLESAQTAFKGVTASCAACHTAHKAKKKST
jgi:cytochrome c556